MGLSRCGKRAETRLISEQREVGVLKSLSGVYVSVYVCVCVCVCGQSSQERLTELRRYADSLEADARRLGAENEARVDTLTSQLTSCQQQLTAKTDELRQAEQRRQQAEEQWKTDNDRLQVSIAVVFGRHMESLTQTVADCLQKLQPGVRAVVVSVNARLDPHVVLNVASLFRPPNLNTTPDPVCIGRWYLVPST